MKTKKTILFPTSFIFAFFILMLCKVDLKAQALPCPQTIYNQRSCPITVFVQFRQPGCVTVNRCILSSTVVIPAGGSFVASNPTCCNATFDHILVFLVEIDGVSVATPWPVVEFPPLGCQGVAATTTGTVPPGVSCPLPASWTMNITPAGNTFIN
jgi:hypothetical protein